MPHPIISVTPGILPIFAVVGPTATGKSDVALKLAEKLLREFPQQVTGVTLISVDSRQVYQGLEIISGADLPSGWTQAPAQPYPFYLSPVEKGHLELHGVSIIKPNQEWSVAHFCQLARPLMVEAAAKHQAVILVGGTGLYQTKVFSQDQALFIPPDVNLRQTWAEAELEDLQQTVQTDASQAWASMNDSDRHNPRRLIRALEKAHATQTDAETLSQTVDLPALPPYHLVTIGTARPLPELETKIAQRVAQRLADGAIDEVSRLMSTYGDVELPALSATGVKEIKAYLEDQITREQCQELWTRREIQYAKRQLTWWKKHPVDVWVEAGSVQMLDNLLY